MTGLILRPEAVRDLSRAKDWYDDQEDGLGEQFLASVRLTLDVIEQNPRAFPIHRRALRRAIVLRFPYLIFYIVVEETVVVTACLHSRRNPEAGAER